MKVNATFTQSVDIDPLEVIERLIEEGDVVSVNVDINEKNEPVFYKTVQQWSGGHCIHTDIDLTTTEYNYLMSLFTIRDSLRIKKINKNK